MLLLVPHLFPSARLLEIAAQDLHLPALETVLARGSRQAFADGGIEAAVCQALGIDRAMNLYNTRIRGEGEDAEQGRTVEE